MLKWQTGDEAEPEMRADSDRWMDGGVARQYKIRWCADDGLYHAEFEGGELAASESLAVCMMACDNSELESDVPADMFSTRWLQSWRLVASRHLEENDGSRCAAMAGAFMKLIDSYLRDSSDVNPAE